MSLTPAQLTILKTDIQTNTDPVVVQALADGNNNAIRDWYNGNASPDYWIFRKMVESDEVRDAINAKNIADITSADRGRAVDLLVIRSERGFSGEDADDRAAWDDIFSAAAGDESQQAILALWSRLATYGEQVFALSTGVGSSGDPDTTSFQGILQASDIANALAS